MRKIFKLIFIFSTLIILVGCNNEEHEILCPEDYILQNNECVPEVKILKHLIDARIEIAGGMRVRELIIVEGQTDSISRTINYKLVPGTWDGETIDFENGAIYNGFSLENMRVSVFPVGETIDFDSLNNEESEFLEEFDPENRDQPFYRFIPNELGGNFRIYHPVQNERLGFYIEYLVSNVVVIHEDIAEIHYRFNNLAIGAEQTWIRVLMPIPTDDEDHHLWVQGPSRTVLSELINDQEENMGFLVQIENLRTSITFRMTMPLEQMMIPIYLNHSEVNALADIINLENNRLTDYEQARLTLDNFRIIIIAIGIIYLITSFILIKYHDKAIFGLYLSLGFLLMFFNLLFSYHII